jgi:hypothetical protein
MRFAKSPMETATYLASVELLFLGNLVLAFFTLGASTRSLDIWEVVPVDNETSLL